MAESRECCGMIFIDVFWTIWLFSSWYVVPKSCSDEIMLILPQTTLFLCRYLFRFSSEIETISKQFPCEPFQFLEPRSAMWLTHASWFSSLFFMHFVDFRHCWVGVNAEPARQAHHAILPYMSFRSQMLLCTHMCCACVRLPSAKLLLVLCWRVTVCFLVMMYVIPMLICCYVQPASGVARSPDSPAWERCGHWRWGWSQVRVLSGCNWNLTYPSQNWVRTYWHKYYYASEASLKCSRLLPCVFLTPFPVHSLVVKLFAPTLSSWPCIGFVWSGPVVFENGEGNTSA